MYVYIYIHIYIYIHTHIHMYIYIYIYICSSVADVGEALVLVGVARADPAPDHDVRTCTVTTI